MLMNNGRLGVVICVIKRKKKFGLQIIVLTISIITMKLREDRKNIVKPAT
jgi:hypothetical protein